MTVQRDVTAAELAVSLTPFDEARERVLSMVSALPAQTLPLRDALGRVVAETVQADVAVPPFDNSAMDGFAVRAADHVLHDGRVPLRAVSTIATGMPLPDGADAVVPWEHVAKEGEHGYLTREVQVGQFVRDAGHDFAVGDEIVRAGSVLSPLHLASLAAIGRSEACVHRSPVVAVVVTGSELAAPGETLEDGQVFDINTTLLPALLQQCGVNDIAVSHCTDDPEIIDAVVRTAASGADLVVTTGGASVGERDWVRTVLAQRDPQLLWRVALRPGKPFAAANYDGTPVLALPGNPGSVLACTHAFVQPAVRRMQGRNDVVPTVSARLSEAVLNAGDRTYLCPVQIDGGVATPHIGSTSQGIAHAKDVNGFVLVAPSTELAADSAVTVELMSR